VRSIKHDKLPSRPVAERHLTVLDAMRCLAF
jgi:hypothetical protein